jgi:riboflavin kinase/FMN adenylyltransferase
MQVIRNIDDINTDKNSVLTVGTFDGVHLGHAEIFRLVKSIADENDFASYVVTFDPHPRTVVSEDYKLRLLNSFNEKVDLLAEFGIDYLVVINFTKAFAEQSSEEFIKNFLVDKFSLKHFVIGHDHKFGKDRLGNESKLREYGNKYNFSVSAVEPIYVDDILISSTNIRNLLGEGNLYEANKLLGRNYEFNGKVISGSTRGKLLGFPTANISSENNNKLIPLKGVYAVRCQLNDEEIFGVMNIGTRPTFEEDGNLVIEVHLFDFNKDIYGEKLKIELVSRIRNEVKFNSKEELIYQIEKDKKKAIQILGTLINSG